MQITSVLFAMRFAIKSTQLAPNMPYVSATMCECFDNIVHTHTHTIYTTREWSANVCLLISWQRRRIAFFVVFFFNRSSQLGAMRYTKGVVMTSTIYHTHTDTLTHIHSWPQKSTAAAHLLCPTKAERPLGPVVVATQYCALMWPAHFTLPSNPSP